MAKTLRILSGKHTRGTWGVIEEKDLEAAKESIAKNDIHHGLPVGHSRVVLDFELNRLDLVEILLVGSLLKNSYIVLAIKDGTKHKIIRSTNMTGGNFKVGDEISLADLEEKAYNA